MNTDENQSTSFTPSGNGFLVYIVVVILVAIFLTYLLILCIIRPHHRHLHQRRNMSSSGGSSSHSDSISSELRGSSNAYPIVRRRSIDPDLLNEFSIQTFHSEKASKAHLKPPSIHNYNANDCVVEISPDIRLEYPEPAHIKDGECYSTKQCITISETPSTAEEQDIEITNEKLFDTQSIASTMDVCPICLDQYEEGLSKIRVLPCSHYFHKECIDNWLLGENTTTNCPCCNLDLSSIPRAENIRISVNTHSHRLPGFWRICTSRSNRD
ncbi:hypothetical protein BGW37DRAFT_503477 [Umbelopsis sp. PMI_123]|nr:hypothetical protein BGW37DRAFT_503477 [Umbelopsis sp. PMI_123]